MARSIVAQVTELERLPMEKLREKWEALFNKEPPLRTNRKHLISRIAYRIQELTYGGLSQATVKRLEALADGQDPTRTTGRTSDNPIPGTKFIREWQGQRFEVTALEKGFEYEGKQYRSLSAIATKVTGTKWNGKQFFGLLDKKKGKTDAE